MATTFKLEHEFPKISLERFEKYLNHPKLNEILSKMPGFRSRDLIEEKQHDSGEIEWRFQVVAGGNVPPAVQKIISPDMFTWIESSRFVPKEHCIYWEIIPTLARGKFEGKGSWQLSKKGKGTKRIIEGEVAVKIPFVGKVVESFIVSELKKSYEIEPQLQQQFFEQIT